MLFDNSLENVCLDVASSCSDESMLLSSDSHNDVKTVVLLLFNNLLFS